MEVALPPVEIVFYREADGRVPVLEWLRELETGVIIKCRARMAMLRQSGHELRRPQADYVGDGIYELRVIRAGQRCRILYSFHHRRCAVLLTGFAKVEARLPAAKIRLARKRHERFENDPQRHGHLERDI